jgi:hypothetical protein
MEIRMAHIFEIPGMGGVAVIIILCAFSLGYFLILRWVLKAGK